MKKNPRLTFSNFVLVFLFALLSFSAQAQLSKSKPQQSEYKKSNTAPIQPAQAPSPKGQAAGTTNQGSTLPQVSSPVMSPVKQGGTSQEGSHRVLTWQSPIETSVSETEKIRTLAFEGASYDENHLPVYYESVSLTANSSEAVATIENPVFEPLKETNLIPADIKISAEPTITAAVGMQKKKSVACVTIFPFRKSATGSIEKLVSFDLKVSSQASSQRLGNDKVARTYSSGSVLNTGDWYKIGVVQKGLYKITYDFLKKMGIDVDKIDPRDIRLYGNGGGQLPFANSQPRYDDLQENAIYIQGEADGKFDKSDYILFNGQRQTLWSYSATDQQFHHSVNLYWDTTYYFLTIDTQHGKRIASRPSDSNPNQTITSFNDYDYHEADVTNFLHSGRNWYGESFNSVTPQQLFSFSMPNILGSGSDSLYVIAPVLGRTFSSVGAFQLFVDGYLMDSKTTAVTSSNVTADYAIPATLNGRLQTNNPNFKVGISFSSTDPSATGWLDYIELNCRRALSFSGVGTQLFFRDVKSVGVGNTGQFDLSGAVPDIRIFDVTDPLNIAEQQAAYSNGQVSFIYSTSSLHEYLAFSGNNFPAPFYAGRVANQNLHALKQAQYLIVTNPGFLTQANELAAFHKTHDGYSANVVTTDQVFNEFSSGAQDVSAIRDFTKMFYDRAASADQMPKFLLLFGDGSYDNKFRLPVNHNFVTTYESDASLNGTTSYVSDDFFGLLDDNEGDWSPNSSSELLDISVGRLPAKSADEAEAMVKKIISYCSSDTSSAAACTSCNTSTSVFGDWRNIVTFVGDDQDQNTHFSQSETLSSMVQNGYPVYNIDKIYLDAYKQESTPGGQRYPEARDAIVKRVQRGTLLITYIGHGGPVGWAHERVLEDADINAWTNSKALAAFLTATCDFSAFDNPTTVSAGELVLLNPNGGGICLFTTTRLAFSGSNFSLAQKFYNHIFAPINGVLPTCGEVFEHTKIDYNDRYVRNFVLLGDPAMRLAYPQFNVTTKTVNSHPIALASDTLKALSKVTITGEVRDNSGNKMSNFNGTVYPTVYDKWATYYTLANDSNYTGDGGSDYRASFPLQKNILYKGNVHATNGEFSFTFVTPKDISYKYGFGKLSYYAANGVIDAKGYDTSIVIGGINSSAASDKQGPDVKLYMNDEKFVYGGLTDANPVLYATVHDENGINTIGNGIGHDITAVMDADNAKTLVLNDYYQSDLDSYQSGKVRYPYSALSEGQHSLNFKVWDVYNNSSEARTEFIVSSSAKLALEHVLNYPNPFTTHTTFMFEHNSSCIDLHAQIQIFTVSGKLIKTIDHTIFAEGYRSNEIQWDGLDDYGDRIGRGVYVYKLRVKANDGSYAEKFEKLVVLR